MGKFTKKITSLVPVDRSGPNTPMTQVEKITHLSSPTPSRSAHPGAHQSDYGHTNKHPGSSQLYKYTSLEPSLTAGLTLPTPFLNLLKKRICNVISTNDPGHGTKKKKFRFFPKNSPKMRKRLMTLNWKNVRVNFPHLSSTRSFRSAHPAPRNKFPKFNMGSLWENSLKKSYFWSPWTDRDQTPQ